MPVVLQRDEMPVRSGPGWAEVTCAGPALFGAPVPMSAREYRIGPGATGPRIEITGAEAMAYVAAGAGDLVLTAGPEGLAVLVAESAGA